MNFPGLINGDQGLLDKIEAFQGRVIDGHAPLLSGRALNAYVLAGPGSDHECSRLDEAREKLAAGLRIMIRQGSTARDLEALLPLVETANSRRFMFVTDDCQAGDLVAEGHLNPLLARAVELGLNPIIALQMVTLNPAEYFGLKRRGAIAPGFGADLVVLEDLERFQPLMVFHQGRLVAQEGEFIAPLPEHDESLPPSMAVKPYRLEALVIPDRGGQVRVIGLLPGQLLTKEIVLEPKVKGGQLVADAKRDVAKLAVVERHRASGNIGLGLVQGFGLKEGALASSVAHDSHNLIGLGTNDGDLYLALKRVEDMSGGLVAAAGGQILAELALPLAGLMSLQSGPEVASRLQDLGLAARGLGCAFDPFMTLSFLALPVIPALKLTDLGLVDVNRQALVDVFLD